MSEPFPPSSPAILVNNEQQTEQEDTASVEEHVSVDMDEKCSEDSTAADNEIPVTMKTVFQQVRTQIRSQKAPKSSILELIQKVRDKETEITQVETELKGRDVYSEEGNQVLTGECKDGFSLTEQELCVIFEKKLDESKKALKAEFEVQISQVRKEMQAYTDQALKDLDCKRHSCKCHNLQQTQPKGQAEGSSPDKKQKPSTATSLGARRGRILSRTMTTIIPKTCTPVIIGPRAKSETLSSSKGESSRFILRHAVLSFSGNKTYHSRNPLPPARPPPHQCKKQSQVKAKKAH